MKPTKTLDDKLQHYLLFVLKVSVVVAAGIALYYREVGAFLYCILAFILMFLPDLIKSRVKISLPIEFDVVLVVFMYASVFLGKVGGAYERFWWWDAALHTSSGFILGFIGFLVLYLNVKRQKIQASRKLLGLTIFCFALAFGAIWEIFEFGIDNILNGNLQRGSLRDTMWDLIVDSLGALVMAWIGTKLIFGEGKGFIARWTQNFLHANPHLGKDK